MAYVFNKEHDYYIYYNEHYGQVKHKIILEKATLEELKEFKHTYYNLIDKYGLELLTFTINIKEQQQKTKQNLTLPQKPKATPKRKAK